MSRIIAGLSVFVACYVIHIMLYQKARIENLNKQIELLECYKENYLIMADSISNIHNSCFRIGK